MSYDERSVPGANEVERRSDSPEIPDSRLICFLMNVVFFCKATWNRVNISVTIVTLKNLIEEIQGNHYKFMAHINAAEESEKRLHLRVEELRAEANTLRENELVLRDHNLAQSFNLKNCYEEIRRLNAELEAVRSNISMRFTQRMLKDV